MMTKKNRLILFFIVVFSVVIVADIFIRLFYYQRINLQFDSTEFNNIASPIISFFGFIGIIITIILSLNQFKHQQSSNYFDYYKTAINKFLIEENEDNLNTIELLQFTFYSDEKYEKLKEFSEYNADLKNFKNGNDVTNKGKTYNEIQGKVRYFKTKLTILLRRYSLMLDEILEHKHLNQTHKDLLLKEFFENQITEYTTQLLLVDHPELKEIKENFYIGFTSYSKETLPFFDSELYELKNKVEQNERLKKYLNV